jgi:hypothetical protein
VVVKYAGVQKEMAYNAVLDCSNCHSAIFSITKKAAKHFFCGVKPGRRVVRPCCTTIAFPIKK